MSDKDILDYFGKRKDQPVCGRFRNEQLNKPIIYISPEVFTMDIPLWKKYLAALFICFSVFMTGCTSEKESLDKLELDDPIVVMQQTADSSLVQQVSSKNDKPKSRKEIISGGMLWGLWPWYPNPHPCVAFFPEADYCCPTKA
jgi:hypothetical protein